MGSKPSRHNSGAAEPLDNRTIQELCQDTGFAKDELLEWHKNFYKDCPDGRLTLKQFEQEYAKIMGKPTAKTADYIRHMFHVYDEDKNNFIDFREFVMALSAASAVNRLRLIETLFHVFDLDNDGKITKEEIGKMLHTLVDVTNSNNKHQNNSNSRERAKPNSLQQRIDDAFNELNANDDDHITKDEFIDWYMKSGLIADVQSEEIKVTGPSDIHKIGKKSRKQVKLIGHTKSHREQDENHPHGPPLVRHMSRMVERRAPANYNDDDIGDGYGNNTNSNNRDNVNNKSSQRHQNDDDSDDEREFSSPSTRITTSSGDVDAHCSKESERWQHLFNSVLGQIRSQRLQEQHSTTNERDSFRTWKREGEEKLRVEYMKQKSTERERSSYEPSANTRLPPPRHTTDERSPSPDIVTIRL